VIRLALILCCVVAVWELFAESADAGLIISSEREASCGTGTTASNVPSEEPSDEPSSCQALLLNAGQGTSGAGASGNGSFGGSVGLSAVSAAGCEVPVPQLMSSSHSENPLCFRPSPVFELLDPPKG
jgi:hypothetical protein